ncbi:TPA: hypothetical protein JES96_001110 [Salmonella enterica subsp. enterica serovar Wangata]|nr:hypothetical protein [Salmonella enterica subsp. enterica serovar Wangata]
MRYILFVFLLVGGLLSFNSYAKDSCPVLQVPFQFDLFLAHPVPSNPSLSKTDEIPALDIHGCTYVFPTFECIHDSSYSHSGSFCIAFSSVLLSDKENQNSPLVDDADDSFDPIINYQVEQLKEYCTQKNKCDSNGFPVDALDWLKFKEKYESEHNEPVDKPSGSDKPGSDDGLTSANNDSGSTGGISDASIPLPDVYVPDNATIAQLYDSFLECSSDLSKFPHANFDNYNPFINVVYNRYVGKCNDIYDRLKSLIHPGDMAIPSDSNHKFITKDSNDNLYRCDRNISSPLEWWQDDNLSPYPGEVSGSDFLKNDVRPIGHDCYLVDGKRQCNFPLGLNYSSGSGRGPSVCSSVYNNYVAFQKLPDAPLPSGNQSSFSDSSVSAGVVSACPAGEIFVPGLGSCVFANCFDNEVPYLNSSGLPSCKPSWAFSPADSGSASSSSSVSGSSDVPIAYTLCDNPPFPACKDLPPLPGSGGGSGSSTVNSSSASVINGNNKGDGNDNGDVVAAINALHADTNKNHEQTMNALDVSGGSLDGVKGGLSSGVSSLIDGLKKEMGDSYNDALSEFKDVFGDVDSYIPDIKLSFDLPVQFTSGIRGRCVPLVFDFNIALAGFFPYHFHAEGVQACKLYDLYVRSVVEWFLYFMTAFACRRVFTRAAEFLTSN